MAEERVPVPGSDRAHVHGARAGKAIDPNQRITALVTVRRKKTPDIAAHRHALSRQELAEQYGADPADIAKVRAFAREHGLHVLAESAEKRTVELAGTVAGMKAAFGATLHEASHAGHHFRMRQGHLTVTQSLAGIVTGVFGLDNRRAADPHYNKKPVGAAGARASAGALTPVQVANLYGFPPGNGSGRTIAIVELGGGFSTTDLTTYFTGLGLPVPSVTAVSVMGGSNNPGVDPDSDGEVMLDIEVAGAVAPAARQRVYFAPNTDAGFLAAVKAAIYDATQPSGVSISWGGPEFELDGASDARHGERVSGRRAAWHSSDRGRRRRRFDGWN